jgi:L-rhamnonate dehydratase
VKITDVEVLTPRSPMTTNGWDTNQDAALVRIHTDEGLIGVGEADASPSVVKAIVDAPRSNTLSVGLREVLVGEDPTEIERLWEKMYQSSIFFGRRGVVVMAMSAVDLALYDLVGRSLDVPAFQLLGGARRLSVPAYASTLMPETPDEAARVAVALAEDGFRAMKFGWGPLGKDADLDVDLVAAIRREVGDEIEIMVDVGFGWRDYRHAIRQVRRMADFRLFWIEEPLPPDDHYGYCRLREASPIPIAAGEENTSRFEFWELLEKGCVDIIQPDVTRCGGLTEAKRIAVMANLKGVGLVPHAWSTGIVQAASLHLNAVLDTAYFLEYCVVQSPLNRRLLVNPISVGNGVAEVPTGPGLGIELNEEVVAELMVLI